jgi:putative tryptophan/tyrosine transport system substrate-binding protein
LKASRLGAVALVALAMAVGTAEAQQQAKIARIGVLTLGVAPSASILEAFRQGLREHGYVEGQNLVLEYGFARGRVDNLAALATDLIRRNVAVIVTESTPAAMAAKQASHNTPIVMALNGDPVKAGLVASLAYPGGNVTGLTTLSAELTGKRLQLLKEVAPKTKLVAAIWNPSNPIAGGSLRETEAAALSLGLRLYPIEARNPNALVRAFEAVTAAGPNALITLADGMLLDNRTRIVEFAAKAELPAIFHDREFVAAGGLMSYGPDLAANFRRAAAFVDKILKGTKPADLPVEQPTQLELVINLKTARALRLTIPQSLVQSATEVIQ